MRKIWDFILKFRIYIMIVIFIIFGVFMYITIKAYVDPIDETAVYGNRLDGIEKFAIKEDKKKEIIEFINEDENVDKSVINIKGKIINIYIKINNKDNSISKMKEKTKEILEKFSEEEIGFYDVQIFVKNEDANYNMIGYKKSTNDDISWVIDEIEKSEVEVDEKKQ